MAEFPYKLGRLEAQVPAALHDYTWYFAGSLPAPPPWVAVPKVAWGMLGNDAYGDCGPAGWIHGREADASIVGEHETWPSASQVVDGYLQYTGGQDSGVVLSAFLQYVRTNGFLGKKLWGYAPVAVHDVPTLQNCVSMYGFSYTGIYVTDVMQQEFQAGKPWDMAGANGTIEGGHCVPIVGYNDSYLFIVTWGGVQKITYPAWHAISSEAWAVLTEEFVAHGGNGHGLALSALESDLNKLSV